VADQREQIDLRTLEEVRRLLSSSDFATADDLVDRFGAEHVASTPPAAPVTIDAAGAAPLPRRR
jgi:hypothetical protein